MVLARGLEDKIDKFICIVKVSLKVKRANLWYVEFQIFPLL